jgi:hypothetical protein
VNETDVPVQIAPAGLAEIETDGVTWGSTVTVTVNVGPLQPFAIGVTVYVAVAAEPDVLVRLPLIEEPLLDTPPVIPPVTVGADHVYVVPAGTIPSVELTGVKVNVAPLHTVVVRLFSAGFGFTVTVMVKISVAEHPLAVTVYVAVAVELVVLVNVCEIDDTFGKTGSL